MGKIIIHAGLHRCASTAIQTLVDRNRAALKNAGTHVIMRPELTSGPLGRALRLLHRFRPYTPQGQLRLLVARRGLDALDADRVLISDENLIGTMPGLFTHRFYPHLPSFVKAIAQLGATLDIHLRFVVRRQDRFLESVYAFRVSRGYTLSFPDFLASVGAKTLSWFMIIRQLEKYRLERKARLMPLEALEKPSGREVFAFLDHDHVALSDQEHLHGNPSLSKDSLRLILALNRMGVGMDKEDRRSALLQAIRQEGPSLRVPEAAGLELSLDERAKLADTLAQPYAVGLMEAERSDLLNFYTRHNAEFLGHPIVGQPYHLWH